MDGAFRNQLLDAIDRPLNHLEDLWKKCYNVTKQLEKWSDLKHKLVDLLQSMVAEGEENKVKIVKSIENLKKKAAQLNSELGITVPVDACEYESLSLCQVEADLKARVENCKIIKQQRLSRYKELIIQEQNICQSMEIESRQQFSNAVPSDQQILDFQLYIDAKQIELEILKKSFNETRTKVLNIMKKLEIVPLLDFEKYIVDCDEQTFKFSNKNMASLKELHQSLERKLEKAQAIDLRKTLTKLWDRLNESYEVRTAFLAAHSGCSTSTIEALKEEIDRCEERKRQNIKVSIDQIREQIKVFWEKCCYGKKQRSRFLAFKSSCYTENVLQLHELELDRLEDFYNRNQKIYELMEKRQELWMKMIDLENRTRDQNRLFDNRGCPLLHEAKERHTVTRDLPKIEAKLKDLVEKFEKDYGKPFVFHDRNISTFIDEQWAAFKENKEREKFARRMRAAGPSKPRPE